MPKTAVKTSELNTLHASVLNTHMVDNQLRTAGVFAAPVLDAFLSVQRGAFVPAASQSIAYSDSIISIGAGRFMLAPLVLGKILQALPNVNGKSVAVYGAATGYSVALLAHMGAQVVAVQSHPEIAQFARNALASTGFVSIPVVECGIEAPEMQKQFEIIIIEGSVHAVPQVILDKISEGGQLLTIIGAGHMGSVTRFIKTDGNVSRTTLFEASAPVVPGFEAPDQFVF